MLGFNAFEMYLLCTSNLHILCFQIYLLCFQVYLFIGASLKYQISGTWGRGGGGGGEEIWDKGANLKD